MGCMCCSKIKKKNSQDQDSGENKDPLPSQANNIYNKNKEEEKNDEIGSTISNRRPEVSECQGENFPEVFLTDEKSGKWSIQDDHPYIIPDDVQKTIEQDFLLGNKYSEFELNGKKTRLNFKERTLISGDTNFSVKRLVMENAKYGWETDDGTLRPFCKELSLLLGHEVKKMRISVKGKPFDVDLEKNIYTDIRNSEEYKIKEINNKV